VERGFQNEEAMMNCAICKTGKTRPGLVTVTLIRGETTVVIKNVPAEVCDNCGEYYLEESVAAKVYGQAEEAVQRKAEVEILRFAA
jgi:YgiT-type zinc finger domain-containing protein